MPTYFYTQFSIIGKAMALVQYGLFLFFILSLLSTRKFKGTPVFWMLVLTICIELISTELSPTGELSLYLKTGVKLIGCLFFLEYGLRKNSRDFLNVILPVMEVIIILNLLTIIIFPNGMYRTEAYTQNYLLGYDNTHIGFQIMLLTFSCIYSFTYYKRLTFRTVFMFGIVLLSTILTMSITAFIGLGIGFLGMLYIIRGERKGVKRGTIMFTPLFATAILILGSKILIDGKIFTTAKAFIANLFDKDITLSARTIIWSNSLIQINMRPWWGNGYELPDTVSSKLVNLSGQSGWGVSPHNTCLMVLYTGGIVLAAVVIMIILMLHKKLTLYNRETIRSIFGLWILVISVMGLAESHYDTIFMYALLFSYNIDYILGYAGKRVYEGVRKTEVRNKISHRMKGVSI
jgi:O-antigen ligase